MVSCSGFMKLRDRYTTMQSLRWQRLFSQESGRCVAVAVDHGLTGEPKEFQGLERWRDTVSRIVAAGPDALLVSAGQVKHLNNLGTRLPALIVRVDVTNAYQRPTPQYIFDRVFADASTIALRADAAAVIVNLLSVPGHPEATSESVAAVLAIRNACEMYAIPLIVEVMVLRPEADGTLRPGARLEELIGLVRLAVELGADAVKVTPPDELDAFETLVQIAGVPLLALGGPRGETRTVLAKTALLIRHGVAGVIFGRNVFQLQSPPSMVKALRHLVHDSGTVEEALQIVGEGAMEGKG